MSTMGRDTYSNVVMNASDLVFDMLEQRFKAEVFPSVLSIIFSNDNTQPMDVVCLRANTYFLHLLAQNELNLIEKSELGTANPSVVAGYERVREFVYERSLDEEAHNPATDCDLSLALNYLQEAFNVYLNSTVEDTEVPVEAYVVNNVRCQVFLESNDDSVSGEQMKEICKSTNECKGWMYHESNPNRVFACEDLRLDFAPGWVLGALPAPQSRSQLFSKRGGVLSNLNAAYGLLDVADRYWQGCYAYAWHKNVEVSAGIWNILHQWSNVRLTDSLAESAGVHSSQASLVVNAIGSLKILEDNYLFEVCRDVPGAGALVGQPKYSNETFPHIVVDGREENTKFRIVLLGVSTLETENDTGRIEVEFSVFVLRLRKRSDGGSFVPFSAEEECNEQGHYYNMGSDLHAVMWDWTCVFENGIPVLGQSASIPSENILHGRGKIAGAMHIRCRVPRAVPLLNEDGFAVSLSPSGIDPRPVMNPNQLYEKVAEPPMIIWHLKLCAKPAPAEMVAHACTQTLHSSGKIKERYPNGVSRWIHHHARIGIGKVNLYDVDGSFEDEISTNAERGEVTYFNRFPERIAPEFIILARHGCELGTELQALDHCLQRMRGRASWGATVFAPHYYLHSQDRNENEFIGQVGSLSKWLKKEAWEPWVSGYMIPSWPISKKYSDENNAIIGHADDMIEMFIHRSPSERRLGPPSKSVKAGLVFFRPLATEAVDCHRIIPKPGDYTVVEMPQEIWRGNWYSDFMSDFAQGLRCADCTIPDTSLRDEIRFMDLSVPIQTIS